MNDVIEWTMFKHNEKAYALHVHADPYVSTNDADCYLAADIRLHNEGSWQFVTLIVTNGDNETESLGACHYGTGDGWTMGIQDFLTDDYYAPAMATALEARCVK